MNEINYWNHFMASGRIEDYLAYAEQKKEKETKETGCGESAHAGFLYGARDGDKPDACR